MRVSCEGLGWGLRRSISESLGGERESIVTHSLRCCIADCSLAAAVVLGGGKIGACSGVCEDWLAEGVRSCRNLPENPHNTSGWTLGF